MKLNVKNSKYAIYCDSSYGPSFGDFDLYVSSNSNKNKDSFLNVGCVYSNGSINRKNYNRNFIADSIYFSTKEIEIFQIGWKITIIKSRNFVSLFKKCIIYIFILFFIKNSFNLPLFCYSILFNIIK